MADKNKPKSDSGMTCTFDGKMAQLLDNKKDVIAWGLVENSIWDRLHFKGASVIAQNSGDIGSSGPVTSAQIYDTAMRTKDDGFQVDKRSAVGGVCDVTLADGRSFEGVRMIVTPPAPSR